MPAEPEARQAKHLAPSRAPKVAKPAPRKHAAPAKKKAVSAKKSGRRHAKKA